MAKRKESYLASWDKLIATAYHDTTGKLSEAATDNQQQPFEMQRQIVDQGLAYRLFQFDHLRMNNFPYFSRGTGLGQMCDYILVTEVGGFLFILLFELKKGQESMTSQLAAGEVFVEFLIASAKRVDIPICDSDQYHVARFKISDYRSKFASKRTMKHRELRPDEQGAYDLTHPHSIWLRELIELPR